VYGWNSAAEGKKVLQCAKMIETAKNFTSKAQRLNSEIAGFFRNM